MRTQLPELVRLYPREEDYAQRGGFACGGQNEQPSAPMTRSVWRDYLPALALLLVGLGALLVAMLKPTGREGQYAVIAPPWYNLAQTVSLVREAQGAVADMSGGRHIVIAHSNDPHFVEQLYRAGAWLVIDPVRLVGCGGGAATQRRGRV
jgi:hypothetical protein